MIASVLAPLEDPIELLGTATSLGEVLGFITGAVCVWLIVKGSVWNFAVGIANVILLGLLFLDVGLYADACLQVVYIAFQAVGWWAWAHRSPSHDGPAFRARRGGPLPVAAVAFAITATAVLVPILAAVHDSAPFWDAVTTSLSLSAQGLLIWKQIENWWFWIAADVIYVPLYASKGLPLTACVYVLFLGMCIYGLRAWRRTLPRPARRPSTQPSEATA